MAKFHLLLVIVLVGSQGLLAQERGPTDPKAEDLPLEQITGFLPPENLASVAAEQAKEVAAHIETVRAQKQVFDPGLTKIDFREKGWVTDARYQKSCGSCWAFATIGAFESAWAIKHSGEKINASEQELLSCSDAGSCGGGQFAFKYVQKTGLSKETDFAYTADDKTPCPQNLAHPYGAQIWGFVSSNSVPSITSIQKAMSTYGPLLVGIRVTLTFERHHGSKVFKEDDKGKVNHAIVIVGWDNDKHAWLIKNSWDKSWGDQGFAWVDYDSNSVGYGAAWIIPK